MTFGLFSTFRRLAAACIVILSACGGAWGESDPQTETLYLSGTGSDDTVDWEFRVSGGRRGNEWSTIPVPSNWEMQGFGTYRYYKDWGEQAAPDQLGEYRHRFQIPAHWAGQRIDIVFGAAMTDTTVTVNGQVAGPTHRGGFYEFRHPRDSADRHEVHRGGGPRTRRG